MLLQAQYRRAVAVLVGLCPLMLVQAFASAGNLLAAMATMHWGCMVALPALLIWCSEPGVREWYRTAGVQVLMEWTWTQLGRGAALGLLSAGVFAVSFYLFECRWGAQLSGLPGFELVCLRGITRELIDSGFRGLAGMDAASVPAMLGICGYFCTVNPLLEELFWRVFLHKEVEAVEGERDKLLPVARTPVVPEPWRWAIAGLFSTYHFAVLRAISVPVDTTSVGGFPVQAALGVAGLVLFGRACVHLRERPDLGGLWAAILWHVGVDVGVCIVLLWPLWTDHAQATSTPAWMGAVVHP